MTETALWSKLTILAVTQQRQLSDAEHPCRFRFTKASKEAPELIRGDECSIARRVTGFSPEAERNYLLQ